LRGQFESLFLAEMLKSMRKAGDVMAEGNYLNTNESKAYRDMFDNQISLSMSGKPGHRPGGRFGAPAQPASTRS